MRLNIKEIYVEILAKRIYAKAILSAGMKNYSKLKYLSMQSAHSYIADQEGFKSTALQIALYINR